MITITQDIIKEIAEELDIGMRAFIHKETGKRLFVPNELDLIGIDMEGWEKELELLENNFTDYYEIQKWTSNEAFEFMEDFAEQFTDDTRLQQRLFKALEKRKPFREFKYVIENSDYRQQWFCFKSDQQQDFVKQKLKWLIRELDENNGSSQTFDKPFETTKFEDISIISKTGFEYTIREGKPTDAANLFDCIKSYLTSVQVPLTLEELESMEMEEWIKKFADSKNDLLLVAEHNGKIIGNIDLTLNPRKMLNHAGYIGMGVNPEFQNQGIGSMLLYTIIQWADNNPSIEILWLQVFGTNTAGINLYKKFGFEISGNQKSFVKLPDGSYVDNIIMTRYKQ